MEIIDLHQPNADISIKMQKNTDYYLQFFSSLIINCIITQSSDDEFPEIIEKIKPDPFIIFHFVNVESNSFVTFCCQNMCVLIEINDKEKFINTLKKKINHKDLFPSTSYDDVSELSNYIDIQSVTIPSKSDQKNLFYDANKIKLIFIPEFFKPEFTEELTLSKFLYLSFDPIIAYSIRRFYYPTAEYDDPSFFKSLNPDSPYRKFESTEFYSLHQVGSGNTGSIDLGIHIETGYIVALKSMKDKSRQSSYEKKFHQLYRHPFILHGYGEYKTGSFIVIITDYMCNGDLDVYCRDQSLDPTSKTKAIAEILAGIDYLHSVGVMHRDLKPKNILISHDKDFIISDFDTAISYTSDKQKQQAGTFPFMARELFTGDGPSFQTDLYSFGIIIYELAMGENPFENLSVQDAIDRITDGKIQQLPSKCGTIAKLYKRCTEDLKNKRASSFYLFEMLFNEILFFSNSNENYIFDLYNRIKELQKAINKKQEVRQDIQFVVNNAQKGEMYSMFNLAVMYHNGWGGFQRDYKLAMEWFLKAAEMGHPASIYDIGNMYYRKRGVPRDLEKAFDYYQRSADLNFIEGYNGLGLMYYNGEVPIKDGQYDPVTHLPMNYYPPDYKKAYESYKYAAERGYSYSICNCGHGFYEGKFCGGKPDYKKAIYWYKKAVEVGNKDAEYNLGEIYLNGLDGNGPDVHQAFVLFSKSAAQQLPKATYQVAKMIRDGIGTKQSYELAANAFRKPISLNIKDAMIDLAELIIDEKVQRKDYCDNPENKNDKVKIGLNLFVGSEEEEKKNFEKDYLINDAIELLRKAVDNQNPNNQAMVELAQLYRKKALELLTKAADAGCEIAQKELEQMKNEE